MITFWPWGVVITSAVTVTIWMNGKHWRAGWLVGAAAQVAQIGFGAVTGIWTFWFAAAPMLMFLWNWWQHPKREAELRRRYGGGVLLDMDGTGDVIMMSRGVFDRLKTPPMPAVQPVAFPPVKVPPLPPEVRDALDEQLRLLGEAFRSLTPPAMLWSTPQDIKQAVDRGYDALAGKTTPQPGGGYLTPEILRAQLREVDPDRGIDKPGDRGGDR
jgi:hypothetical protein